MAASEVKGTVTPLESLFSSEDARRAARRVEESISERRRELDCIRAFVSDNTELVNLIQKLPRETSHEIMVPFGGAAFFPGKLIHTNEFLVYLGETYYAERSMEQTVEILQRRGNALEAQVHSLKAVILDLEAEASFFNSTAIEAAEGLVEIREEYSEPAEDASLEAQEGSNSTTQSSSRPDHSRMSAVDEEEYARVMARFDEFEKEELVDEGALGSEVELDGHENREPIAVEITPTPDNASDSVFSFPSCYKEENRSSQSTIKQNVLTLNSWKIPSSEGLHESIAEKLAFIDKNKKMPIEGKYPIDSSEVEIEQSRARMHLHNPKDWLPHFSTCDSAEVPLTNKESRSSETVSISESHKAFTGLVVERHVGLPGVHTSNPYTLDQTSRSNSGKPVSRFKMQRKER